MGFRVSDHRLPCVSHENELETCAFRVLFETALFRSSTADPPGILPILPMATMGLVYSIYLNIIWPEICIVFAICIQLAFTHQFLSKLIIKWIAPGFESWFSHIFTENDIGY